MKPIKMDEEVSPLEREHLLSVLLPGGMEKNATVHGSKPVMDLLVTLCANYHLNPSDYTVEVLSPNKNNITFTPNSPIGSLEADKIVLKPKAGEDKIRTPYMPEATVRLLINYNKSHKAVVRVNPRVPLEALLPMVCEKCEFQVESTVLLRDSEAKEGLDLSKTLNELGLREVYAKDTGAEECSGYQHLADSITSTKVSSSFSLQDLTKKEKKKSENKGFLSLFRKHKKKSEPIHALSAPSSPGPTKSRSASVSTQDRSLCSTPVADMPKKRRAPQPPMGAFHSFPNNLSSCHLQGPQSGENTLRSTKRKAPPPPPVANHPQEAHEDLAKECLNSVDEEDSMKQDSSCPSPSPSSTLPSSSPLHKRLDSQQPTTHGKDLSDARAALAKVLTTSLSSGMLIKRLKNTKNTEPNSENGAEMISVLNSNLPTENDFEDLQYKTGLTTFKVVPSRRESDAEPIQAVLAKDGADADSETAEQIIPEDAPSENGKGSRDQSESSSPTPCPDEGDTNIYPLQLDNQNDNSTEMATQDEDNSDEIKSMLPSGSDFEDPLNKTGLTTFKVVPSRRESDVEPIQRDLEDNNAETETAEQVPPDTDPSVNLEEPPVQSEPIRFPDEGETASSLLQLDEQNEDSTETSKQQEVGLTEDHKEEMTSDQSVESVTNKDDLYLAEEEVDNECSTQLTICDPESYDKTKNVTQDDDSDNFPPPPPPVYFNEDSEETTGGLSVSAPTRGVTNGHVRSNSEPPQTVHPSPGDTDRTGSVPSRFAQAVALAVQRSRLHSTGKTISALLHQET